MVHMQGESCTGQGSAKVLLARFKTHQNKLLWNGIVERKNDYIRFAFLMQSLLWSFTNHKQQPDQVSSHSFCSRTEKLHFLACMFFMLLLYTSYTRASVCELFPSQKYEPVNFRSIIWWGAVLRSTVVCYESLYVNRQ